MKNSIFLILFVINILSIYAKGSSYTDNKLIKAALRGIECEYSIKDGFVRIYSEIEEFSFLYFTADYDSTKGYNGITNVAVLIKSDYSIFKVKIVDSEDTPSFVRRVKSRSFLNQFMNDGYSADIELVTGATITSRAIDRSIKNSMKIIISKIKGNLRNKRGENQ